MSDPRDEAKHRIVKVLLTDFGQEPLFVGVAEAMAEAVLRELEQLASGQEGFTEPETSNQLSLV